MISYHISSIRYCGYCSRWCLIERIQWYSAVVVPESQLFLSLLLQCWMELYLLPRMLCPLERSNEEKESQDKVSFSWAQPKYQHYAREYSCVIVADYKWIILYKGIVSCPGSTLEVKGSGDYWGLSWLRSQQYWFWQANQIALCPMSINASREISLACLITTKKPLIHNLQMSTKCPTSEEQTCEQEAAASLTEAASFIFQHWW